MDYIGVTSSNIDAVGYDERTKEMRVRFHNGGTYSYKDVPKKDYEALVNAPSVGKHFNAHVSGRYNEQRLTGHG